MIEFKQIVGRGTRLFDGKEFFTIYDYVNASEKFEDLEWDGPPMEPVPAGKPLPPKEPCSDCGKRPCICEKPEAQPCKICGELNCSCGKRKKVKIKLRDGKEREIQSMIATSFWSAEGKPISAEEFLNNLFGELPNLFKDEAQLREIWSKPNTRKELLEKLDAAGFPKSDLEIVQKLVNMEKSDLFDVLEYVFNGNYEGMTREERVATSQATIFALLDSKQREFIEFVLSKYIESGVEELDLEKLPRLIESKYKSFEDARQFLGSEFGNLSTLFVEFQKHLYEQKVA
jgi:type I restriction enzyme R subunit